MVKTREPANLSAACVATTILPAAQMMSVTLVTETLGARQGVGAVLDVVEGELGHAAGAVDRQDDWVLIEGLQGDVGLLRRGVDGELAP
ncbi:MAG: hypothetical protein U0793_11690 [Gemmataceae bacterium]